MLTGDTCLLAAAYDLGGQFLYILSWPFLQERVHLDANLGRYIQQRWSGNSSGEGLLGISEECHGGLP